MKRLTLFGLCCATLLGGCTTDPQCEVSVPKSEQVPILLEGSINQVAASRADSSGFCNGDAVGIYAVNYDGQNQGVLAAEGNQADNVRFIFNFDEYRWVPDYDIYFRDDNTAVDIIGYYPYASEIENVYAYSFEVQRKQSTEATEGMMGGYESSDFLWGKTENVAPTTNRIKLLFHHAMAGVQVDLIEGSGFADGEWAGLDKQILVTNTIRKATIDLSTGEVTTVGAVPDTDIIPAQNGTGWRAVVVPQTVAASTQLVSITVDGIPYSFRKDVDMTYTAGKLHKFTISVSKKESSGLEFSLVGEAITAWEVDNVSHEDDAREYVVVHNREAGRLEKTMTDRLEMDVTKVKNLKLTGEISTADYEFMRDKMTSLMRLNLKEVESKIDGVYKIPRSAFEGKATLIKCVLPDKLERIEGDILSGAFQNTSLSGTLQLPVGLKHVSGFRGTKITNVQFPSTLEEIGPYAFSNCKSLMCEISLPHSLKRIENCAFEVSAIKGNLVLPEGLEYIGEWAFRGCYGLTGSLTIPNGIKTIRKQSFQDCSGFTGNLTLPMGLTEIQSCAFDNTRFKGELNIPSTVITIGNGAFRDTEFSGTPIVPKELISLGSEVFRGCWRLSGVVEIPENIVAIPSLLFSGCSGIEGIVLHKDIEVVESDAFSNCFGITSIISKAKNPPTIASSSFNGVAKDNFTVEVPEASVKKYEFASGWSDFKRIAAHQEFSISRNLLRTLNGEHSKTFTLHAPAGEAWSVESKPEWVTITPSSGEGKVDVTITTNELAQGNGNRTGEVVFLLNNKDYRTRMNVEQYDYTYSDGDLITHQTATIGNGVNLVLMGDCFDAKDISEGKYVKAMEDAYNYFFDIEPYKTYKEYFNVYSVVGMSADSGMGTVNTIRESRFGSQYTLNEGVSPNFETVFAGACVAPINDNVSNTLIILVENSNEYSGLCYMWGDGSAVAIVPMSTDPAPYDFQGLIHHEAGGHGFGKLADEYIYHNAFIQSCSCPCCGHVAEINAMKSYGFYTNISLTGNMQAVPWSHMIYDPQFSNVVDVYEGAFMHSRGVFRSEATSCMNNNIAYYNAISRESMVKRIMKYAGEEYSYEAFKAKDVESLPSTATQQQSRAWEGVGVKASSRYDQREPKLMGKKPQFDKKKF